MSLRQRGGNLYAEVEDVGEAFVGDPEMIKTGAGRKLMIFMQCFTAIVVLNDFILNIGWYLPGGHYSTRGVIIDIAYLTIDMALFILLWRRPTTYYKAHTGILLGIFILVLLPHWWRTFYLYNEMNGRGVNATSGKSPCSRMKLSNPKNLRRNTFSINGFFPLNGNNFVPRTGKYQYCVLNRTWANDGDPLNPIKGVLHTDGTVTPSFCSDIDSIPFNSPEGEPLIGRGKKICAQCLPTLDVIPDGYGHCEVTSGSEPILCNIICPDAGEDIRYIEGPETIRVALVFINMVTYHLPIKLVLTYIIRLLS